MASGGPMAGDGGREAGQAQQSGAALRRWLPLLALVVLLAVLALLFSWGTPLIQRRATLGFIELVAVVGLYVFVGNSGLLSFGHVGFMAIAAYGSALLSMKPMAKTMFLPGLPTIIAQAQLAPLLSGLVGACCAALFALLVGLVLMRLSGMAASIATFALLVIVNVVLGNWDTVTGGQRSLMGVPAAAGLWSAVAVAVVAVIIAFAHGETRSALLLRAAREDQVAAVASGVGVYKHRLVAFVLSAFVSGMAGALMAHLLGTLRVDTFYLDLTFITIAMLVVGGSRSLTGAVLGTLAVAGFSEIMRGIEAGVTVPGTTLAVHAPAGLGDVLVALAMLLVITYRPGGLADGKELSWPRGRQGERA